MCHLGVCVGVALVRVMRVIHDLIILVSGMERSNGCLFSAVDESNFEPCSFFLVPSAGVARVEKYVRASIEGPVVGRGTARGRLAVGGVFLHRSDDSRWSGGPGLYGQFATTPIVEVTVGAEDDRVYTLRTMTGQTYRVVYG